MLRTYEKLIWFSRQLKLSQIIKVFIFACTFSLLYHFVSKPTLHPFDKYFHSPTFSHPNRRDITNASVTGTNFAFYEDINLRQTCTLPNLNPFDPIIAQFIEHPRTLVCHHVQPALTYVDDFGYLHIDSEALMKAARRNKTIVTCSYKFCESHFPLFNERVIYADAKDLRPGVPVPMISDCVEVSCKVRQREIYNYVHTFPSNMSVESDEIQPTNEKQLSVMLFFLDSVSNSMMKRNLPSTLKYLNDTMNAKEMLGYTRVGFNSFTNFVPALTGKRANSPQPDMLEEYNEGIPTSNGYNISFDHWDIVWKHFAKQGYATGYLEETPKYSMFHYLSQGFKQKPVHHFYFPAWVLRYYSKLKAKSTWQCIGNRPTLQIFLDDIAQHIRKYNGKRWFLLPYFMEMSHDVDNEIERGDDMFETFFRKLHEDGYLNHSVMILLSDHGIRYGNIRNTYIGKIEESMPMFIIAFPKWFYRKYPHIEENLITNRGRLTSHFDLHETLQDIAYGRYSQKDNAAAARGISLLERIPANRTCQQAGIPLQYCPCARRQEVNVTHDVVRRAAEFLVSYINGLLKPHSDICAFLTLIDVMKAEDIDTGMMEKLHLQIAFQVGPSNGTFDGIVSLRPKDSSYEVVGDLQRTNRYGQQSKCVGIPYLRQFCYCYDFDPNAQ